MPGGSNNIKAADRVFFNGLLAILDIAPFAFQTNLWWSPFSMTLTSTTSIVFYSVTALNIAARETLAYYKAQHPNQAPVDYPAWVKGLESMYQGAFTYSVVAVPGLLVSMLKDFNQIESPWGPVLKYGITALAGVYGIKGVLEKANELTQSSLINGFSSVFSKIKSCVSRTQDPERQPLVANQSSLIL